MGPAEAVARPDDTLVGSQRLAEWATNAPELEEEVALANIALDLLGQARVLLSRAGHLGAAEPYRGERSDGEGRAASERSDGEGRAAGERSDEDVLTYFRDERAFRNVVLAEADLGDFARTMAWVLVFSSWRLALTSRLVGSRDAVLAAVAEKAVKELTYHRDSPPSGSCASATAPRSPTSGCRPGSRRCAFVPERFLAPTKFGDELTVTLTAKQITPRDTADYGEVRWDADVTNQHGESAARYDVLTLVAKRGTSHAG